MIFKMKKGTKEDRERYNETWRWRFALFPVRIATDTCLWLGWYQVRGGRRYEDFVEYRYDGQLHRFNYVLDY